MKNYLLFLLLTLNLHANFFESIEVGLEGWNENSSGYLNDKTSTNFKDLNLKEKLNPSFYIDTKIEDSLNFKFQYSSILNNSINSNSYESSIYDLIVYSDLVKNYLLLNKYFNFDLDLGLNLRYFNSNLNNNFNFSKTMPMGYLRAKFSSTDIDFALFSQTLYSPIYGTNIDTKIGVIYTFFNSLNTEVGYRYNKLRINETYNANIISEGPFLGLSYKFNFTDRKREEVIEENIIEEETNTIKEIIILDDDKDNIDKCPNTKNGIKVNAFGCSDYQLDDDNDTVSNAYDICIDTNINESVDENGCSQYQIDDDSDTIFNALDICPNTDTNLSVNEKGCAKNQLDSDEDNITDDIDLCPNTAIGTNIDETGCEKIIISIAGFEDIQFEHASTKLTKKSKATLGRLAKDLKKHPNYNVNVEGHTSNGYRSWKSKKVPSYVKSEESIKRYLNTKISQKRADVVKKYLIKIGTDKAVITARGFGPDKPKATNETSEGRAKNRRVEIVIDTLER